MRRFMWLAVLAFLATACAVTGRNMEDEGGAAVGLRSGAPTMDYHGAIESYYRAFREKDLALLRSLLTPDFHFVSSFGEYRERDSMLREIWPSVGQSWATNLRIVGNGPDFVAVYEHENAPGVQRAPMRMAEYIRFRGEQIAQIEVFVGRPLEPARHP